MKKSKTTLLPVVDIFAGPGGLGEGFYQAGHPIMLSVEVDPVACETLKLRKVYRRLCESNRHHKYYELLKANNFVSELKNLFKADWEKAGREVLNLELGSQNGNKILHTALDEKIGGDGNFILVGGPPCQAYSIAGRSRMLGIGNKTNIKSQSELEKFKESLSIEFYKDKRHTLYKEYLHLLCRYQPKYFVMENVKGLGSARESFGSGPGGVFENVMLGLTNPYSTTKTKTKLGRIPKGYKIHSLNIDKIKNKEGKNFPSDFVLRSEEHGVPQTRHRLIFVGVREDIDFKPKKMTPLGDRTTVKDIIYDLPKLRSGLSKELDSEASWKDAVSTQVKKSILGHSEYDKKVNEKLKQVLSSENVLGRGLQYIQCDPVSLKIKNQELNQLIYDPLLQGVLHHETRSHIRQDLLRYFLVSMLGEIKGFSPKFKDWVGELDYIKPNHKNVTLLKTKLDAGAYRDRFKVQVWQKPSSTIVSHISKDGHYFIHPDPTQCRSLTVREAARLQTFPDNYYFYGTRTQKYHQVGNAVPVLLAKKIAYCLQ